MCDFGIYHLVQAELLDQKQFWKSQFFQKPQSKFRLNVMDAPPWSRWASSKFLVLELYRPVGENERRVRGKRKWQDTSSWMLFTRSSLQAYPALHLRAFLRLTRAFLHPPEKRKKIKPVPQAEIPLWKEPFFSALKETGEWMDFSQGDFEPQINFQIHSHFCSFHLQWNNETCSTS